MRRRDFVTFLGGATAWMSAAHAQNLSARLLEIASTMGADFGESDIHKTTEIVRRLSGEAKERAERLPRNRT
jgi:hypothetical protein